MYFKKLWNVKSKNPNKTGGIIGGGEGRGGERKMNLSLMTLPGYPTRLILTHCMTSMKLSVLVLISI